MIDGLTHRESFEFQRTCDEQGSAFSDFDVLIGDGGEAGEICRVVHRSNGVAREYRDGSHFGWLTAFRADLGSGVFGQPSRP